MSWKPISGLATAYSAWAHFPPRVDCYQSTSAYTSKSTFSISDERFGVNCELCGSGEWARLAKPTKKCNSIRLADCLLRKAFKRYKNSVCGLTFCTENKKLTFSRAARDDVTIGRGCQSGIESDTNFILFRTTLFSLNRFWSESLAITAESPPNSPSLPTRNVQDKKAFQLFLSCFELHNKN